MGYDGLSKNERILVDGKIDVDSREYVKFHEPLTHEPIVSIPNFGDECFDDASPLGDVIASDDEDDSNPEESDPEDDGISNLVDHISVNVDCEDEQDLPNVSIVLCDSACTLELYSLDSLDSAGYHVDEGEHHKDVHSCGTSHGKNGAAGRKDMVEH